ncbi:MAG: glutathione S-transferase N-terminal domain-containing protein [Austwickia sp.]|jgi:mycoredoxin|nr:glutathione S-transferase N-terminal domain-containing protein [Austwickia sp.]MBK8436949.1 glutathione S-transferase N-terminal domain-containing protein [Austwickia sp.]MBK9100576.1 glutathione S-transferase N-terminal domain-containing protein [Austwickia sp.]
MVGLSALAAVVAVFSFVVAHSPLAVLVAVLVTVGLLISAWLWRTEDGVSHWEAQERNVRDGRVIVYWRPGCPYCYRLRLTLGQRGRALSWVDIWADDEAAAFVRDLNAGSETVPTVILRDGSALTNPPMHAITAQLTH